jgi:tetratricopeptide (TPR) repeat protein
MDSVIAMATYSADREFVQLLRPILETGDFELLVRHIQRRWPCSKLCDMLFCGYDDATKVALFCLSLTGTMDDCPAVACLLRHDDEFVRKLAENTMWSIWFRAGGEAANGQLRRAVHLVGEDRLDEARVLLSHLIEIHPTFAEAYNQRAIVHFLLGNYARARHDLLETLRGNPMHFAAMAGLGHCYAAVGKWQKALAWYERAARLYPWAEGLKQAVDELNRLFVEPDPIGHKPQPTAERPSSDPP